MKAVFTIDHGNSHPHVGIFQNNHLKRVLPLRKFVFDFEVNTFDYSAILSQVGAPSDDLEIFNKRPINVGDLKNGDLFLDMPVDYSDTIGQDRLALAYYVYKNNTVGERALVIDAGTFLTVDCVNDNGFEGGFIFPGGQTFLNSYTQGHYLPKIRKDSISTKYEIDSIPHNTKSAIKEAYKVFLKGIYQEILNKYQIDTIWITGGDGEIHREFLESIFSPEKTNFNPHLIHHALYLILKQKG